MRFSYGPNAKPLAEWAEIILEDILTKSDVKGAVVTRTKSTPEDQARIMYDNLEAHGVASQRALYKPAGGGVVINVYEYQKTMGATADAVKHAMEQKIIELGPEKISAHCMVDPNKSVFDVAPSSIPDERKKMFMNQASVMAGLIKFLRPPVDPAFHIEIKNT